MFRSRTTLPIIKIRDIAFQNLTSDDKRVLSAPRQLTAEGTLVVPGDILARNVAATLREAQANRIIVLDEGTSDVFGALAPDWVSEQIRANLNLHGDFHDQLAQWEDLQHEQLRQFKHEWIQHIGQPPIYYCNCHKRSEARRHDPLTCYV